MAELHGERYRESFPQHEAGEEMGRQTKKAPHSTRAKWLEGQGACVCMGEATDPPLCPFFGEKNPNTCLIQGRGEAAEVGRAPPAL